MLCITHAIWTQEFFMVNIHKYLSLITFNCYFSLVFIQTFGSQNSLALAHFPHIFPSRKKITSASIIATKLLSAESLGFGISTAIKRIAGRFFLLRRQEKSIMAACLRARDSLRPFTRQGFAHREKTRENVRVHPKFAQGSCSVKNSPVYRRSS